MGCTFLLNTDINPFLHCLHFCQRYQFKLERWTNLGCSVLAAFGSQEEDVVQLLHDVITGILKCCPNNGLKNIDHMLK